MSDDLEEAKREDLNQEDIQFDMIQPIEDLIIFKVHDGFRPTYNTRVQSLEGRGWRPGNPAFLMLLLRRIIKDLLADPRFKNCQYLSFQMHERPGVRIFGAANACVCHMVIDK